MNNTRDILDGALNMLKERTWNGPAVNPVLERAFSAAGGAPGRRSLRLVLGVGAALIGCGAVAAAARPAWRSVFGEAKAAPKVVAAAETVAPEAIPAPAAAPRVLPAPKLDRRVVAAMPGTAGGQSIRTAGAPAAPAAAAVRDVSGVLAERFERSATKVAVAKAPANPYMKQMSSVLWDRYHEAESHGDTKGCDAIKGLMRVAGIDPEPAQEVIAYQLGELVELRIEDADFQGSGEFQFTTQLDGDATIEFSPIVVDGPEKAVTSGTVVIQGAPVKRSEGRTIRFKVSQPAGAPEKPAR